MLLAAAVVILFMVNIFHGSVNIPCKDVLSILSGGETEREAWRLIVLETRLPHAVTALLAGASISVAGLLLQTLFNNPLAGPEVLGINSGAGLGVALVMLLMQGVFVVGEMSVVGYLAVFFESTDDHAMDYIHEGMRLIQVGEYEQAYQQLLHAQDDMRAYNSLGVSLMMQGRFEDAMPWFEKAVDMNSAAAKKNMAAIQAEYDYEAACRQEIENYLKKYE